VPKQSKAWRKYLKISQKANDVDVDEASEKYLTEGNSQYAFLLDEFCIDCYTQLSGLSEGVSRLAQAFEITSSGIFGNEADLEIADKLKNEMRWLHAACVSCIDYMD